MLYKQSDGGGLQLWTQPNGSRLWRLAYRFGGKQKLLALGTYPSVSLADARERRDAAKKLLAAGVDPSEARKAAKAAPSAPDNTFGAAVDGYLAELARKGRTPQTLHKVKWVLGFALPTLGPKDVRDIRAPDVLPVLRAVEARGRHETAHRLRETIGCVFRYAVGEGNADADPTPALRGKLAAPQRAHRAAVTKPSAFGAMLRAIDGFDGQPTTCAALKLMALLFPRPGEMRGAEWAEFDFAAGVWAIPKERMKMKREHRIPLATQALAILDGLRPISGRGRLVFPSVRTTARPISENTLNAALRRLGYSKTDASAHGFRATASTLLNESGKWHADAIERQLAHVETNNVRRAYDHGEHWAERVRMMQWWADHLDGLAATPERAPAAKPTRKGAAMTGT